jgi:bacterioferritin
MPQARTDQRILGYLGRALSLELSAVQMYSTQARLVATWGLDEPARRLREEAHEEMQHVERIIARMLALGVAPNASQLRPVKLGADLQSLLKTGYAFEEELVELYAGAATYGFPDPAGGRTGACTGTDSVDAGTRTTDRRAAAAPRLELTTTGCNKEMIR